MWALDCGNARYNGHVVIGNLTNTKQLSLARRIGLANSIPSPYLRELLPLQDDPLPEQPQSRAELTIAEEQSIMVNEMVAATAGRYIDQYILQGQLTWMRTSFTLSPFTAKTVPLTEKQPALSLAAQIA
ncbi:MAG: hypothetical protein KDE09_12625 [Anaerolineales bacterium]|nr:hypothetical protein [Anaerolineales bacterium]